MVYFTDAPRILKLSIETKSPADYSREKQRKSYE